MARAIRLASAWAGGSRSVLTEFIAESTTCPSTTSNAPNGWLPSSRARPARAIACRTYCSWGLAGVMIDSALGRSRSEQPRRPLSSSPLLEPPPPPPHVHQRRETLVHLPLRRLRAVTAERPAGGREIALLERDRGRQQRRGRGVRVVSEPQ